MIKGEIIMNLNNEDEIFLTVNDHVATLTINRPKVYNALDTEILYKIEKILDQVENDKDIYALIITGSGDKSFVAGANIRDLRKMTPETAKLSIKVGHKVFQHIEELSKPSIAVINGHCLGGGLEIAMSCDIRICVNNIKIGLPEANVGMIPGWGGTMRLQRIVGQGRAKEMILLGKTIDPQTAKNYGLISEIYDDVEKLRQGGQKMAYRIASLPPHVMALDKRMIADAHACEPGYCALQDSLALAYCFTTKDSIEGLDAFLEKRKPIFKGE